MYFRLTLRRNETDDEVAQLSKICDVILKKDQKKQILKVYKKRRSKNRIFFQEAALNTHLEQIHM